MEGVRCYVSRDTVGLTINGELCFSNPIGHTTNRTADVGGVGPVIYCMGGGGGGKE